MTHIYQKRLRTCDRYVKLRKLPQRTVVILFFFAYMGLGAQNPVLEWARGYGGTERDAAQGVALDHQGGVYWTGEYSTTGMNFDIRIVKLDTTGTYLWEHIFGSQGYDAGTSIEIRVEQGQPFVYVLGYFSETVDFDPGPGTAEFTSKGATDVFLAKYDGDGAYVQAWTFGDHAHDYGWDLALDPEGNMYVAGAFRGQVDFDPGPDTLYLTAQFGFDAFVLKLDSAGHAVFAVSAGGAGTDQGQGVALDFEGNVITTGYFSDVATFASSDTSFSRTSQGAEDAYVWKLNPQGETIWCNNFGAAGRDKGLTVITDDQGNIYVGGEFAGTVDFDPGPDVFELTYYIAWDAFIQKLGPAGDFIWARALRSFVTSVKGLELDGSGHLFCIGSFGEQLDLGTAEDPLSLHSIGNDDVFMAMFDASSGQTLTAASIGGDQGDWGLDMATDSWGNMYLAGYYHYTADFDPGPGYHPISSHGDEDAFIVKWKDTYVGIETPIIPNETSVYPNPAVSQIFVESPITKTVVSHGLFDMTGKQVAGGDGIPGVGIDISGLAPALYVLNITFADGSVESHKVEVVK